MEFPYRGISMHGTFRPGDVLLVEHVAWADVHRGDVIAFRLPQPDRSAGPVVVHRVRACTPAGLVTCGDGVSQSDPQPVTAEALLGRVLAVRRGAVVHPVRNGAAGRLRAFGLRLRRGVLRLAGGPYALLRASGLVRRLWRPRLEQVRLATPQGPLVKYVHRGRTVAVWYPRTNRSWCRKPYDLVVDLPTGIEAGPVGEG